MAANIQRIERSRDDIPIYCLFCGQRVVDLSGDASSDEMVTPCPHTLFIATGDGFEFRSARFNEVMEVPDPPDEPNPDLGDESIDEFTDRVEIEGAVKIVTYAAPPGGLDGYVGLALMETDEDA
jgi:hypothetical protein